METCSMRFSLDSQTMDWIIAAAMDKKLHYTLRDLEAAGPLRGMGVKRMGTCPRCGHDHLSIDTEKRLFHCFYAGCGHSGRIYDGDSAADTGAIVPLAGCGPVRGTTPTTVVRHLPSDYARLSPAVTDELQPLMVDQPDDLVPEPVRVVREYLRREGIDIAVADRAGVRVARHRVHGKGEPGGRTDACVVYVNHVGGQPVNAKYRSAQGKLWAQDSPTTPCAPYNIDCLNPLLPGGTTPTRLFITEGEKDTLALLQAGYRHVVSVPSGAESDIAASFEAFTEWTDAVRDIVICSDTDYPGRVLQQHLIDHFGARCFTVAMPDDCKDMCDVLKTYGTEGVRQVADGARPIGSTDIITVDAVREGVHAFLEGHTDTGFDLGYGPLTDHVLHLTDGGGLIIVTGKPNAGKTDWLNDLCAHLMFKCERNVCLCSFETASKEKNMAKMLQLAYGRRDLSMLGREELTPAIDRLDERLTHLDMLERRPTPDNILLLADMVLRRRRISLLVVDPYMFVDLGIRQRDSETNAIRRMLVQFQTWGRRNHVWVAVVAHPRKLAKVNGTNELEQIDMYTIAGSANWANLADFILAVSRHTEEGEHPNNYTRLDVLKVRDQDLCSTGSVLYRRQPCGRYDERPDIESLAAEAGGAFMPKDSEPWLPLTAKE